MSSFLVQIEKTLGKINIEHEFIVYMHRYDQNDSNWKEL